MVCKEITNHEPQDTSTKFLPSQIFRKIKLTNISNSTVLSHPDVPDPPALLNTDDIEAHQITLHWLLDKSNGIIKSVVIERRQLDGKSRQLQWDRVEIHKPITKYTFSNLEEDSMFEFRLRARNIVGLSLHSEIQRLRTKNIQVVGKILSYFFFIIYGYYFRNSSNSMTQATTDKTFSPLLSSQLPSLILLLFSIYALVALLIV